MKCNLLRKYLETIEMHSFPKLFFDILATMGITKKGGN
jgi:hypothetical protein